MSNLFWLTDVQMARLQPFLPKIEHAVRDTGAAYVWHRDDSRFWSENRSVVQAWLNRAGQALAFALVSACAVTDSRDVIVDGVFPEEVHAQLITAIESHLQKPDTAGLDLPRLRKGTLGAKARTLGAAAQVINAHLSA